MANDVKPKGTPPIIDTSKLVKAEPDPRGDNRPGVYPDAPQPGIDPITNLREDLVNPETRLPKPVGDLPAEPLNPAPADVPRQAATKKPKGKMVRMIAVADIWPHNKPDGYADDQEYRVKAGEEVELPEEEAMDRMEAGTAKRADRRG